ncbi:MAG: peptidase domain-containing ABC transporter, partial [Prevotella sp.]|nr:peptidase domain-containing ABC transporter [Prevotella sp.]
MKRFTFYKQPDSMMCGVTCLQMICKHYGKVFSLQFLSSICHATTEGVSLLGIKDAANKLGFYTMSGRLTIERLTKEMLPCILHWNQNHFVVLYDIKKGRKFYIADPGKGLVTYGIEEFKSHWIGTVSDEKRKGIAMFLEPAQAFYQRENMYEQKEGKSFRFLLGYINQYRKYFAQILIGLFVGSLLQLALPFLTQNIVDVGIKNKDIDFIWLVLIGQLVITLSRTSVDFIRRWLLLHISMRINISLVSDFFIKLLRLPMSFFDTKLMGDLMQRIGDHSRVNSFLTQQTLSVAFSLISFAVFSCVLLVYNGFIFIVFFLGSVLYGGWMTLFLRRRKVIDYELFEQQAINNNKTYQFLTSMQEIKLQDCEQRRRWEWEDVQAGLFKVQMKSLKLQQTQEAGGILINEIKNIIIT